MKERKEKKGLQACSNSRRDLSAILRAHKFLSITIKKMLKITSLSLISSMGKHTPMLPYIIILKPN